MGSFFSTYSFREPSNELAGSLKKSCVELESESATAVLSWLRSKEKRRERGQQHESTPFPTQRGLPRLSVLVTALQRRWPEHSHCDPAESYPCWRTLRHSPKASISMVNLVGFPQMVVFWKMVNNWLSG